MTGSGPPSAMDVVTKLSNLLPTGTFLTFQALAPLFTNNGECKSTERIMTGILLFVFAVICWVLNFTDSVTTPNGAVYYGIVTSKGLFSPQFKGSNIPGVGTDGYFYDDADHKYRVNIFDYINGVLDIIVLGVLTMLTAPITTCFYPKLSNTIVKTIPVLVAILVGVYFAFAPAPRNGLGFSQAITPVDVGSDKKTMEIQIDSRRESLLASGGQGPVQITREQRSITVTSPHMDTEANDFWFTDRSCTLLEPTL
ncbi:hypothetical protein R1sor_005677 [Riccia sorocarpa]|uniref:Uncharacterized protein n=1 Tax=Riccia sorocarpa TaxID=122646 RepID=A0ABD3HM67_9MARC